MPDIVVAAQNRTERGKNTNRRLRVKGLIPGVLYQGDASPQGLYGRLFFDDLLLKSSQRKDLGDVKARKGDSQ